MGGTIEFDITDNLYLGSGLGFAKKGASSNDGNFNLYYVEVPIGARYDILEIGSAGYMFVASGFNLGVMVSANNAGNKLNIGTTDRDNLKPIDLGVNGGLGLFSMIGSKSAWSMNSDFWIYRPPIVQI